MWEIYGYCREVALKGMGEDKIKTQEAEILKEYPKAEIITEIVGSETFARPIFNEMVENCKAGDTIVCTKLDRFCRSTKEAVKLLDELLDRGIKVHILNMGVIDDSETGELIYNNILAFNDFQLAIKVDRMNTKKEVYKENNREINYGRPRKFTDKELEDAVKKLETHTYTEVAEMTGISKGTLWREKIRRTEVE